MTRHPEAAEEPEVEDEAPTEAGADLHPREPPEEGEEEAGAAASPPGRCWRRRRASAA